MSIPKNFITQAKKIKGTVIFAEGDEPRTLAAAAALVNDGICSVVVVAANRQAVEKSVLKTRHVAKSLRVIGPSVDVIDRKVFLQFIRERRRHGDPQAAALQMAADPLYFSALYVKSGKATSMVAGARSDTADVIRAAVRGIGPASGVRMISSFMLMVPPAGHPVIKRPVVFADCAVNADPGALTLQDIACASIRSFRRLFPAETARVAFLSFSTKGSAEHRMLHKIREAVELTKSMYAGDPSVLIDGEIQFDAAVLPGVGKRKAPGSPVAGYANIFIFPDLNAGNIAYKVAERIGRFSAIGPVMQGLSYPATDLSRGCSVEDIYNASVITLLQSRTK